jgi:predicted nucleotidyltransferase
MALYAWHNCPTAVREQIDRLSSTLSSLLSEHLIGIYLHGSLAMGCFNPHHSDLDLLVITTNPLSLTAKRQIIEDLLSFSRQPHPIEISFLARSQLLPWQYPTPFDLHYSEMWRDTYTRDLLSAAWQAWNMNQYRDPDLAAHITILNARGICLIGEAITAIFPVVPVADYHASLAGDIQASLASIETDPIYAVLNCCRTYAYLRDGRIYSKEEGGRWALGVLPANFCDTVTTALTAYSSDTEEQRFEPIALIDFAAYMHQRLAPVLQQRAPS